MENFLFVKLKLWRILIYIMGLIILTTSCQPEWVLKGPSYDYKGMDYISVELHKNIRAFLYDIQTTGDPVYIPSQVKIKSVLVNPESRYFEVEFTKPFSYIPFREVTIRKLNAKLQEYLNSEFKSYQYNLKCLGIPISELIPNYYRTGYIPPDKNRMPLDSVPIDHNVVRRIGSGFYEEGLSGMNIAVWPSHGWYYNHRSGRWEWQRPRLFQTVEDLLSVAFVTSYLIPMLENAGANVFVPRERDIQINEVIVDNDDLTNKPDFIYHLSDTINQWRFEYPGYKNSSVIMDGQNPFCQGSHWYTMSDSVISAGVEWIPRIPKKGMYAVYVSYHSYENSVRDAQYTVYHSGGETSFVVNQQIGGSTWIYLGKFLFNKGRHQDYGKVKLVNKSKHTGLVVTADAVRFGGGMGTVERGGFTSARPRFMEAGRYWLQYAGYPDSLVYKMQGDSNDYVDDYKSRPEFTNYLSGRPLGPTNNRNEPGFGIPIDLSLAFHTDAGIDTADNRIGTMVIYSLFDPDSQRIFPDGISRITNRDWADILQSQVLSDIRNKYDITWPRRILKEAWYSEAARPNRPTVILELLSHQNFRDTQLAANPRFRFDVCRAVYKAMLRYLASQYQKPYVIQPLPVQNMAARIDTNKIEVTWQAQFDPLEPSANAKTYIVYMRQDSGGFDNGQRVFTNRYVLQNPQKNIVYNFFVRAENDGGLSMDSEIVSACIREQSYGTVLVVNGFDRISGPYIFKTDRHSGFLSMADQGVPDRYDINFTGMQIEFDNKVLYSNNDAPGHGASYADFENMVIPGNSFDFIYTHGKSISNAGWSFASCSDEVIESGDFNLNDYFIVDWILGEEKETPGPDSIYVEKKHETFKTLSLLNQDKLKIYLESGGNLFISGAYVGTDLNQKKLPADPDVRFTRQMLKLNWLTNHAARNGRVWSSDSLFLPLKEVIEFNTNYHPLIYSVEAPDAFTPLDGAATILRYSENNFSAAIGYKNQYNLIVCGFPFETIVISQQRDQFMQAVIRYLTYKCEN